MVYVVGDIAQDVYWVVEPSGISAEAPIPIFKHQRVVVLPGMAANVAALMGVGVELVRPTNFHTPVKNRFITQDGHQLMRWDVEDWCSVIDPTLLPYPELHTPISDVVEGIVVCDYGKGAVTSPLISRVLSFAEAGVPVFVDTKCDPFAWVGATNITLFPNCVEYTAFAAHYNFMPKVVLKKGAEGAVYMEYGNILHSYPSYAEHVHNVCGAGDCVIAEYAKASIQGLFPEYALQQALGRVAHYVSQPWYSRGMEEIPTESL
jgi:D-beta-D-heptose 7-phosphate kinase/D-beta-D-heptose 1-phosphate adenosyltransferase